MPPRESADAAAIDAAAEDAALDGAARSSDAVRGPGGVSRLADRYGRTPERRRRERWLLGGAALAFAVVLVAWVVWAGLDGSRPQVEATDLGHRLIDDHAVEVTWRLSVPAGNETACIVQAFNEDFTIVGWKVVEIPASERPLRTFTETVRTALEPNTGLVSTCWLI
ncbi:DUF4307 domain-containing protein [Agromyces indicus]|uniref:DUF4307 domain-containing protein n=1 Tax=Agromyces indicus TaxID=758919 RepID=A0ABU1FIZ0_9MICO|nr:DUF4307 domain-containing protein [Agromyces indicus]MDR5691724.1 DUF4307 domain-containing protein [Agromyces indicus]